MSLSSLLYALPPDRLSFVNDVSALAIKSDINKHDLIRISQDFKIQVLWLWWQRNRAWETMRILQRAIRTAATAMAATRPVAVATYQRGQGAKTFIRFSHLYWVCPYDLICSTSTK